MGKNKRIKDILGYLQEDVPGMPVGGDAMADEGQPVDEEDEETAVPPVPVSGTYAKKKKPKLLA